MKNFSLEKLTPFDKGYRKPHHISQKGCESRAEGYICTRKRDHNGKHAAHDSDAVIIATWRDDDN